MLRAVLPLLFLSFPLAAHAVVPQAADVSAAPTFMPFTVRPDLINRREVLQALEREYPAELHALEIGGTVLVHFFINVEGRVQRTLVAQGSGYASLDQAALRVASVFEFTPAFNLEEVVPVWINIPIVFRADAAGRSSAPADLSAAPFPTPYTVDPGLTNELEALEVFEREYSPVLRDAGIGGTVAVDVFIDEARCGTR